MRAAALALLTIFAQAQGFDWKAAKVDAAMAGLSYALLVQEGDRVLQRGELDPSERLLPCSTFKLPHALIALEQGAISLQADRLTCDPKECHDAHGTLGLDKAIRESCLSYFRQVARRLGPTKEREGILALGYPAQGDLNPADAFWVHGGSFGITLRGQLGWIRRFYTENLGVNPAHLEAVRAATRRTETPSWTLWGKTGSSGPNGGHPHGWFVGRVQWKDGHTSYVALLVKSKRARFLGLEAQARLEKLLRG